MRPRIFVDIPAAEVNRRVINDARLLKGQQVFVTTVRRYKPVFHINHKLAICLARPHPSYLSYPSRQRLKKVSLHWADHRIDEGDLGFSDPVSLVKILVSPTF